MTFTQEDLDSLTDYHELDQFKDFECLDCSVNTYYIHEYYMVQQTLWEKIHPTNKGMLCVGCVEKRLGRKLNSTDFIFALVNDPDLPHSERLKDRLTTPNNKGITFLSIAEAKRAKKVDRGI